MDTMLKVAVALVVCGLPVMFCSEVPRRLTLKAALKDDPEALKKLLRQPLTEAVLGFIITYAVLFFARVCLVGTASMAVAVGVAYAAVFMCSAGAFIRSRTAMNSYGLTVHEKELAVEAACYSLGMALMLGGLLTLLIWLLRFLEGEGSEGALAAAFTSFLC